MIDFILKSLEINKMHGVSKEIDIAKGVNLLPMTFKQGWKQRKRKRAWKQK